MRISTIIPKRGRRRRKSAIRWMRSSGVPYVSAAGTIVFVHDEAGHEQATVPPGFNAAASSDTVTAAGASELPSADGKPMDDDDVPASPPTDPPLPSPPSAVQVPPQQLHPRVSCDACEGAVTGIRYNCLTKFNFDLCEGCMWGPEGATLREGHKWMKMSFVEA